MRDLPHLASLVFNRPLLYRGDIGTGIIDAIGPRILNGEPLQRAEVAAEFERPRHQARAPGGSRRLAGGAYMARDGIAVLPIVGSLVRRGSWLDAECGMMSYGLIRDASNEILNDPAVRGLMLEFDSGGGEANGCFDCADSIREISKVTGKPVWAHANEIMCSAAYALGCIGGEVWVARTAEIGSIGVLGAHVDRSGADKMAGVKWTYVFAGDHKTDGNAHEPLAEDALARMQADVDNLMSMFVRHVSQNSGMTEESVRATKAEIFRGELAVEAGLADEVGTLDEALQAFAEHVDNPQTSGSSGVRASQIKAVVMASNRGKSGTKIVAATQDDEEGKGKATAAADDANNDEDGDEGPTAAAGAGGDGGGDDGDEEKGKAKASASGLAAVQAETDRCAGLFAVAQQAARLGVAFDASAAVRKGMSVADARAKVMEAAADGDDSETSAIAVPKAKASGLQKTMSAEDKKAAWAKAMKARR